jgi:hypothetical protein
MRDTTTTKTPLIFWRALALFICGLAPATPLLAGAPPKRTPAARKTASPVPTPAPVVRGWQDLAWGMTAAQVTALHTEAQSNRFAAGLLSWKTTISGKEFEVVARFDADALRGVRLTHIGSAVYTSKPIPESSDPLTNLKILRLNMEDKLRELKSETAEAYTALAKQVESGLREKYGEPDADGPAPPAGASEKMRMAFRWSLPETLIELWVMVSPEDNAVKILGVEYKDANAAKTKKPSAGL